MPTKEKLDSFAYPYQHNLEIYQLGIFFSF